MAYTRITALWNGAAGLPGYSRFKFVGDLDSGGAAAAAARLRTFFDSIKALLPAAVNITFAEAAQIFDLQQQLTGEVAFTPPTGIQGTAAGTFASPVGMVVNWTTGSIVGGRKVRGRTYLVPAAASAFSSAGQPVGTSVTTVTTAANALAAGTPALTIASKTPTSFGLSSVVGASVPVRAAVLRSRRD